MQLMPLRDGACTQNDIHHHQVRHYRARSFVHVSPSVSLSDGSMVYDVTLGGIVLHAVTEDDAYALADKIVAAIEAHSTDVASVV